MSSGLQQQIARVDIESGRRRRTISLPAAMSASRCSSRPGPAARRTTGCLITLVFDAAEQRTRIVGLDARDVAAKPLFVARLKHHVPFSLHGYFQRANDG